MPVPCPSSCHVPPPTCCCCCPPPPPPPCCCCCPPGALVPVPCRLLLSCSPSYTEPLSPFPPQTDPSWSNRIWGGFGVLEFLPFHFSSSCYKSSSPSSHMTTTMRMSIRNVQHNFWEGHRYVLGLRIVLIFFEGAKMVFWGFYIWNCIKASTWRQDLLGLLWIESLDSLAQE